jgi:hypothetical protein
LLSLLLVDHYQVSQTHLLRFNQISISITCLELHIVSFETMSTIPSKSHDMRKDVEIDMVERCEASSSDDLPEVTKSTTMGTVTNNDSEEIFLVPSPSSDPRGMYWFVEPDTNDIADSPMQTRSTCRSGGSVCW